MAIYAPSQINTNYDWARAVLTEAGLPATDNNAGNLLRWVKTEKPSNAYWYQGNNPLNLNTQGQSDGYDRYPSIDAGAKATASFLNMPNYVQVKNVLANNGSPADFSAAVIRSPWAESHYGVAAGGAAPKWVVPGRGLDYIAQIPVPDVFTYSGQNAGAGPAGASNELGTGDAALTALHNPKAAAGTCDSHAGGFVVPHTSLRLFNQCQTKALVGGLLVGAGSAIFILGLAFIASKSKTGQQVIGVASGVATGGAGRIAGAARGIQAARVERANVREDQALQSMAPEGPTPRNRRQANREAEDVFDRLGVSRPIGETDTEPAF